MKKFGLVLLGLFFSLLCLEIGLQTAGILLKTAQKHRKKSPNKTKPNFFIYFYTKKLIF
jgi:hypothetical protein